MYKRDTVSSGIQTFGRDMVVSVVFETFLIFDKNIKTKISYVNTSQLQLPVAITHGYFWVLFVSLSVSRIADRQSICYSLIVLSGDRPCRLLTKLLTYRCFYLRVTVSPFFFCSLLQMKLTQLWFVGSDVISVSCSSHHSIQESITIISNKALQHLTWEWSLWLACRPRLSLLQQVITVNLWAFLAQVKRVLSIFNIWQLACAMIKH